MLLLRESDRPRTLPEKLAEYLARPPQPILKFYGGLTVHTSDSKKHLLFAVRNGLPLPLLYGIYVTVKYDSSVDYIDETDHIGPFSTDNWRLTFDNDRPVSVKIRVGLVPFEIITDREAISI